MRLKPLRVTLRSHPLFKKFKSCLHRARVFNLHVTQFALLGNHLHMIVEAPNNRALTLGMRSLAGSFGKSIRSYAKGKGAVFAGRFHVNVLKTPRQYRNTLKYVLLNHSQHADLIPAPDQYSSGPKFRRWGRLLGDLSDTLLEGLDEYPLRDVDHLSPPQSWLGRVGWLKVAPTGT